LHPIRGNGWLALYQHMVQPLTRGGILVPPVPERNEADPKDSADA
jgi:hypothetical protein